MQDHDQILTALEVALELRCSKAHVYKLVNGRIPGVPPLPAIRLGRRVLIRQSTLEHWTAATEMRPTDDRISPSPEVDAAGRMKGELSCGHGIRKVV
jgi:excisionase family DNA binding protein